LAEATRPAPGYPSEDAPLIPNAHPNATVLALAERAADLILGREDE
jgi:hypothetical protein